MPQRTPPPSRPAAPGREQPDLPRRSPNAVDGAGPAQPLQDSVRARDVPVEQPAAATEAAAGEVAAAAPENGHLHHELPSHPGVPLAPPGIVPESDVRTHSPAAAIPPRDHATVEELGELPWSYGDGRLVCLVRDPSTVYVYWDLSQQQIEQAFGGLGSARASL